ncbi:CDP-glycerol glycerophosphotransferase family protein [Salinimicrobium tongyeongense]|uniref:CDP-glycerol glycerophosphotransferase family protein n=1 Tax=Salinimicrobium tongyeongense TaxID=2809707 RepID=A0ABY6NPS6_9FLAO|nr:CDP-glycerol glycerophosphotransferase family protein [Salinimicrobium tongyeongense]UZH54833.1 CDP-glycerol glycerophosphotransferase family protein [Salinimicrobium tongyeongense]
MKKKYKVAFLFLDEIHHLYHFITVATELAKEQEVHVLTHPQVNSLLYSSLQSLEAGEKVKVEELKTSAFRAITDKLKGRDLPRKGFWLKKNMKYLLQFDALVFTDYFHHYLLKSRQNSTPKLIKFPHGAPGRAYIFNKNQLDFDFQLLSGKFQFEEYQKRNLLGNHPAVVGYPKADFLKNRTSKDIFSNNKPTVLYNPHFDPALSSWKKTGLDVLEFFYQNKEYNVIFAPHLHLFQKKKGGEDSSTIPEKFFKSENIHIDLGSEASVDMSYVSNADIYLGDVSSQVFEFIINPRPCIFLNPYDFAYEDDIAFRFWQAGQVIQSANELEQALRKATTQFDRFKPVQERMNEENFYSEDNSTATQRAARAITEFLDKEIS